MLRILISLFWKGFAKDALNSEKINFDIKSDRVTKRFSFSRYFPFFKKAVKVLVFCSSTGSNSTYWHAFQGTRNNFTIWFWVGIILDNIIYTYHPSFVCKKITLICVNIYKFFYKQVLWATLVWNFPKD